MFILYNNTYPSIHSNTSCIHQFRCYQGVLKHKRILRVVHHLFCECSKFTKVFTYIVKLMNRHSNIQTWPYNIFLQIDEEAVRFRVGQQKLKSSKTSLMDRLRDRLQNHRSNASSTDQEQESTVKFQKLSTKKETHRVHFVWYHFDEEKKKSFMHVRARSGGFFLSNVRANNFF